jgi:hypothetical protein
MSLHMYEVPLVPSLYRPCPLFPAVSPHYTLVFTILCLWHWPSVCLSLCLSVCLPVHPYKQSFWRDAFFQRQILLFFVQVKCLNIYLDKF